jgi:hypothetical protein
MSFLSKKNLQQVIIEHEPVAGLHVARLNKLSADLKLLISKLGNIKVPFTYIYVLSSDEVRRNNDLIAYEESCLTWAKDAKGNFQLRYNVYAINYELDGNGRINHNTRTIIHVDSRPVFELKVPDRLRLEPELPSFYDNLMKILQSTHYDPCAFSCSPYRFDPLSFDMPNIWGFNLRTYKLSIGL